MRHYGACSNDNVKRPYMGLAVPYDIPGPSFVSRLRRRNIATSPPQVGPFTKLPRGFQSYALGPVEGFRHAKANILRSEMAVKSRLSHSFSWLFSGSAKNEFSARLVDLVGEFFQRLKTGGIDCSHIPESEDNDRWKLVQT